MLVMFIAMIESEKNSTKEAKHVEFQDTKDLGIISNSLHEFTSL